MPEIPTGLGSGTDRLQALRQKSQSQIGITSPSKIRIELLAGIGAFLVLIVVLFVLFGGGDSGTAPSTSVIAQQEESADQLQNGDAFIAIALEEGSFPPGVARGDQVRVVVTPHSDGTGTTRALQETTTVESVNGVSDIGGRFVVTVRGPESVALAVAASEEVHLAIIREARS